MKDLNIIFGEANNPAVRVQPVSKKGKSFLLKEFGEDGVLVLKSQVPFFTALAAWHGLEWHSLTASCYAALYPHKAGTLGSVVTTTQGRGAK